MIIGAIGFLPGVAVGSTLAGTRARLVSSAWSVVCGRCTPHLRRSVCGSEGDILPPMPNSGHSSQLRDLCGLYCRRRHMPGISGSGGGRRIFMWGQIFASIVATRRICGMVGGPACAIL